MAHTAEESGTRISDRDMGIEDKEVERPVSLAASKRPSQGVNEDRDDNGGNDKNLGAPVGLKREKSGSLAANSRLPSAMKREKGGNEAGSSKSKDRDRCRRQHILFTC